MTRFSARVASSTATIRPSSPLPSAPPAAPGKRVAKAVKLYYAVRDAILYDPYVAYDELDTYRASTVLARGRGYCVGKAALLRRGARARHRARIAFADVRNHLATPRLLALVDNGIFFYHGITELWLGGRWLKATPTFNLTLCEKLHIKPLEFDGSQDAILHPYDREGRRHMEYVRQHGSYADVPAEMVMKIMRECHPRLCALKAGARGDFTREAEALG